MTPISSKYLGYTSFVVYLQYSYSFEKNLLKSESQLYQCLHNVKIQLGQATGCLSTWIPAEPHSSFNFQEICFQGNQVKHINYPERQQQQRQQQQTLENTGSTHRHETLKQAFSLHPQKHPLSVKIYHSKRGDEDTFTTGNIESKIECIK